MKLAALAVLCACHGAYPPAPTLPDSTLGSSPASRPSGEPIEVKPLPPVAGSALIVTLDTSTRIDLRQDRGGKRQDTEQHVRLRVEILGVDGDHASELAVTALEATRQIQVDSNRDDAVLLHGTYIVAPGTGGDPVRATRRDGSEVPPGELGSLDDLIGDLLGLGDPSLAQLIEHPLRLGETIPIELDTSRELYGEPTASRYTLALVAATAASATYQIDLEATSREPNVIGDVELKGRHTLVFDRVRGLIVGDELVTWKTERNKGRAVDTLDRVTRKLAPQSPPRAGRDDARLPRGLPTLVGVTAALSVGAPIIR